MTYTYTFVSVPVKIGTKRPTHPTYEEVINEYARQEWRFVQLVVHNPASIPTEYILIFEQPVTTEASQDGWQ